MPSFFENLAPALPIAGAIGSAALQRSWAIKDWNRQNAYNTPKAQIERLKQAGLPLATMFGGQGGSTSSDVRSSNVDPSLGVGSGLQTMMQRKQMALLDQQIREQTAGADIKENERDFLLGKEIDGTGVPGQFDYTPQYGDTNLFTGMRRERAMKETELKTGKIMADLKQIDLNNAPEKIRAEIDHLLRSIGVQDNIIAQGKISARIADDLMKGGTGYKGILRLLEGILYKTLVR